MTEQMQMQSVVTGVKTDNPLYNLRMKYERSKVVEYEEASDAMETEITRQFDATGRLPSKQSLGIMAGTLGFIAENIERQAEEREIQHRTASEWRQLEYGHVTKSFYTEMDMQDEVMPERWADYRECNHRFCIEVWKPRRKDQQYCDATCRNAEHYARAEFERTSQLYDNGTYLPEYAYKTIRDEQKRLNYEKKEIAFGPVALCSISVGENRRRHGGKRDRDTEERRGRTREVSKAVKQTKARKTGEVIVRKQTAEELEAYFIDRFSAERVIRLEQGIKLRMQAKEVEENFLQSVD